MALTISETLVRNKENKRRYVEGCKLGKSVNQIEGEEDCERLASLLAEKLVPLLSKELKPEISREVARKLPDILKKLQEGEGPKQNQNTTPESVTSQEG